MTAKKTAAPLVETANGTVTVDVEARYKLSLAKAVTFFGHVMRPSDRNIEVTGQALLVIAATAAEGAIVDATLLA